jgi:hypothetical protein
MRREEFEKAYAEAHDMRVEDFVQYRMGDTYRLPMIAKCCRWLPCLRKMGRPLRPAMSAHDPYGLAGEALMDTNKMREQFESFAREVLDWSDDEFRLAHHG